jgi:uncharacterized DUF497 family protein
LHEKLPFYRKTGERDYGETRVLIWGTAACGSHHDAADTVHVISFRKANRTEVELYEQEKR